MSLGRFRCIPQQMSKKCPGAPSNVKNIFKMSPRSLACQTNVFEMSQGHFFDIFGHPGTFFLHFWNALPKWPSGHFFHILEHFAESPVTRGRAHYGLKERQRDSETERQRDRHQKPIPGTVTGLAASSWIIHTVESRRPRCRPLWSRKCIKNVLKMSRRHF